MAKNDGPSNKHPEPPASAVPAVGTPKKDIATSGSKSPPKRKGVGRFIVAERPYPPPSITKKRTLVPLHTSLSWGEWMARVLPAILALAGVFVTAVVGLTSTVFKLNDPPVAELSVVIGTSLVTGTGSVSGAPNRAAASTKDAGVVPVGHRLLFTADRSFDPDGTLGRLTTHWSVFSRWGEESCSCNRSSFDAVDAPLTLGSNPIKEEGCPRLAASWMEPRAVTDSNPGIAQDFKACSKRTFAWQPPEPGTYVVELKATDDQECPVWRTLVFGVSGCNKTSVASVLIRAVADVDPAIVIQPHASKLRQGEQILLDASQSISFDGSQPTIVWFVDGLRRVASPTLKLTASTGPATIKVDLTATDQFGKTTSRSIELEVEGPQQPLLAASTPSPPVAAPDAPVASPLCSGQERYELQRAATVDQPDGTCRLPRQLITNGHAVMIKVAELEASDTLILSFEQTSRAMPGEAGRPGVRGEDGSGEGQRGADGSPGGVGLPGEAGQDGGAIFLTAGSYHGKLEIKTNGLDGAPGGDGGSGGRGGNGAQGQPSLSGAFDCRRGPGRGGDGGAGGRGGNGGSAGRGGDGGAVTLSFAQVADNASVSLLALGGQPGTPGSGGEGGVGGRGGPEGEVRGFCGSASRRGQDGPNGAPGAPGASASAGVAGALTGMFGGIPLTTSGEVTLRN